jgi:hypothetical protein
MKKTKKLSYEDVCDKFSYDPITGNLYSKIKQGRFNVGDIIDGKTWSGHIQVVVGGKMSSAHKIALILCGEEIDEGMVIDHIDGNPQNNSRKNLRIVTVSQNNFNRQRPRNTASENVFYPGVSFDPISEVWIVKHGTKTKIRYMPSLFEAMCLKKHLQNGGEMPPRIRKNSLKRQFLETLNV